MRKCLLVLFLIQNILSLYAESVGLKYNEVRKEQVIFSHDAGFYSTVFDLTLTSPEKELKIIYTIDGSDPSTSASAKQVSDSVRIKIDPDREDGRAQTPAFIVRAAILDTNGNYSITTTKTYIFIFKVKQQKYPGGEWPKSNINRQMIDYEMDYDVSEKVPYSIQMYPALIQIPSISVVTNLENLFDSQKGIYVNAEQKGIEWERVCSVELINPDGGNGFQVNAGLRIRGGNSAKNKKNPKHGFRLFFREEYGTKKLEFPLFGDEGVDEFECIDLRCEQNYSWSMDGSKHNTMIKDVFCRDLQHEMGQPYKRGKQYHLYLNGMYWGIYQTDERAEASYAESYIGGDKDDFDVIKVNTQPWPYYIEPTDGNIDAWNELWKLCNIGFTSNRNYFKLEGKKENGQIDPDGKVLVDIDNLIDYMLIIFYSGNFDAPVSAWSGNDMPNNFYAIYNSKNKSQGFKFLVHDSEHSMFFESVFGFGGINENRVNLGSNGSMKIYDVLSFNPQWLHYKLCSNNEYVQRFANRAYSYLSTGGILSPEKTDSLFRSRVEEIDMAIVAESARWGDAQASKSLTKNDDWLPEINKMYSAFFPQRSDILINQLKKEGLWPTGDAPKITVSGESSSQNKYNFEETIDLSISNPNNSGTIYYTLTSDDPRTVGGGIASNALSVASGEKFSISTSSVVCARVKFDNYWGPQAKVVLRNTYNNFDNLRVTELYYHPQNVINGTDTISGSDFEFIEFKNIGNSIIDLSGLKIDSGITYQFPNAQLQPGDFFVVASKPKKFLNRYGFLHDGNYSKQLSNSGELLSVFDENGQTIISFTYADVAPWPEVADGDGYSLVSVDWNPKGNPADYSYWKSSAMIDGSPGEDDRLKVGNEVLADNCSFKLYPNPSKGTLTLSVPNNYENVEVTGFSLTGREIFKTKMNHEQQINLNNYSIKPGILIVMVKIQSQTFYKKITIME